MKQPFKIVQNLVQQFQSDTKNNSSFFWRWMKLTLDRLANKKYLIMRDSSQAVSLIEGIRSLGGIPLLVPLISFKKTSLSERERKLMNELTSFDWLIFTSQNGVRFFMAQLEEMGLSFPEHVKVAAVGTNTQSSLVNYGISPSFIPKKFTGEALADEMKDFIEKNERICVIKGNLARDIVGTVLRNVGAIVEEIIIYETFLPGENKEKLIATLKNKVDVLIFTSPSTVKHFMSILMEKNERHLLDGKWVASIGPVTKKALEDYGIPVHICPDIYTVDQLLEEMKVFFGKKC